MRRIAHFCLALCAAAPALAGDLRDYCPTRPGLGNSACTVDPGHVSAELSLADWTRDSDAGVRTDTLLLGDALARIGVGRSTEVQLGWTPFGTERVRERSAGTTIRQSRVGDVTLGVRRNLSHPDGSGFSAALQPFVSLPVGRSPIGAGDWGAGLIVPLTYELGDSLQLEFVPEADAAVDEDGKGRHFAANAVGGVGYRITKAVTLELELQATRDNDPSGHTTAWLGAASLAWQAGDDLQLDVQANAGLGRDSPEVELLAGIAKRF